MDVVSIIVPIYNAEKWLNKCLDSIVNQTYKELEIVLVDDGSTDRSLEICNKYKLKDNRINVISIENNGVANCRNVGLDNAHGDYVLYVDSDDWIEIDMVEKLHKISIDYKLDIVVCNMTTENRGYVNEFTSVEILSNEKLKKEFIKHKSVNGSFCNKLINKALLTGLHFNEEIGYGEDAALMWEIIKKDPIMGITEYSFYHYQNNPNSISRKSFSSTKYDAVRVWKKILNDVEKFYSLLLYYARVAYIDANLITLWEMARANYIDKENEVKFLNNLKKYYKEYCRAEWISKQRKVFASTCIINYRMAGKILRCIKR